MADTLNDPVAQQGQVYDTGAAIFGADGQKLGSLSRHGIQNGYLVVHHGMLMGKDAYVPLSAIINATADGIHLNINKSALDTMVGDMAPQSAPADVGGTGGGASTWTTSGTAPASASREPMTQFPPLRIVPPGLAARQAATPPLAADMPLDHASSAATPTDQSEVRVPVTEEELVAGKRETERGHVDVHKEVVEEPQTVSAPLTHEEVRIEHVPVSGASAEPDADAFQNQDITIPVKGEELVTGKRATVEDEVRISKQPVTEERQVTDTVRKEQVNLRHVDEQGNVLGEDGDTIGQYHDEAGAEPASPANP